jgi:TolB protein
MPASARFACVAAALACAAAIGAPHAVAANPLFWSKSGIAFTRFTGTGMDRNGDVWTMRADGTHQHRLTTGLDEEADGVWSPNRKKIAYTDYGPGNERVYVMNADGSHQHPVTPDSGSARNPAWSPNGKRIAYQIPGLPFNQLGVVGANGSNPHAITSNALQHSAPSWTADGKRILYAAAPSGYEDLYSARPDGTHVHRITKTPNVDENGPVQSPDGSRIAFRFFADPNPLQIAVMHSDGSHRHAVTKDLADHYDPAWSPSGNALTYDSGDGQQIDIFKIRLDGTHRRNITKSPTDEFFRD